jgi:RNase P protein component
VHYLPPPAAVPATSPQAGFVVSRAVGGSVERHRVIRRLRHLVRDRLVRVPSGARLVIRALPPAGSANSATLGRDLDAALDRLIGAGAAAARTDDRRTGIPDRPDPVVAGESARADDRPTGSPVQPDLAAGGRAVGAAEAAR